LEIQKQYNRSAALLSDLYETHFWVLQHGSRRRRIGIEENAVAAEWERSWQAGERAYQVTQVYVTFHHSMKIISLLMKANCQKVVLMIVICETNYMCWFACYSWNWFQKCSLLHRTSWKYSGSHNIQSHVNIKFALNQKANSINEQIIKLIKI
jgi:hypothetical protein